MQVRREGVWAILAVIAVLLVIVGVTGRFGVLLGCITCPAQLVVTTPAGNAEIATDETTSAGDTSEPGGSV